MDHQYSNNENIEQVNKDTSRQLSSDIPYVSVSKLTNYQSYTTDQNVVADNINLYFLHPVPDISQYKGLSYSSHRLNGKNTSAFKSLSSIKSSLVNETTALRPISSASTVISGLTVQDTDVSDKPELIRKEWKFNKSALTSNVLLLFDTLLAFLWIGPLVSVYWYSTWAIGDRYFFKENPEASYWLSTGLGIAIITVATLLQNQFLEFSSNRNKPVRFVLMRVFNYIMSFASVNQWRGVWDLEDYYTGISTLNALLTYVLTTIVLLILRGQRSVLYPPTSVSVDVRHAEHYKMATFCSVSPGFSLCFLLDTVFTVFIIEPLTISVWRGLWELADCQLYPDDNQTRTIWCLAGSYCIGFTLALLQVPIRRLAAYLEKVSWYLMLAFEDVITSLYIVFTVISWRGIWLVFEVYAPQGTDFLWMCHFLSFGILVVGLSASSAMTQVGPKDGSIPNGNGVTLELGYLTSILTAWHKQKETAGSNKDDHINMS